MKSDMLLANAGMQQRSDLAEFGNITNLLAGIGDLSGLFALRGLENYDFGGEGNPNAYTKPFELWNLPG